MLPDVVCPFFPPNYELGNSHEQAILEAFAESDYLIIQRVSDDFSLKWLTPGYLRANFPGKLVIWPNLYFDAYYPDVGYFYKEGLGKIVGPLGDYHFENVKSSFRAGLSIEASCRVFREAFYGQSISDLVGRSVLNLQQRESSCDVLISDFVFETSADKLGFYTPNHPRSFLLYELFRRIKKILGLPAASPEILGEMNDTVILPHPSLMKYFDCMEFSSYLGVEVFFSDGVFCKKGVRNYSPEEMIRAFFAIYDKAIF